MRYFVLDSFTSRRNFWCILYVTFSFLHLFYFMCMFACIAHICSTCVSGGCGGQKRVSDLLELEYLITCILPSHSFYQKLPLRG